MKFDEVIIERTGSGYRVRPVTKKEANARDVSALLIIAAGLIACVLWFIKTM